MVNLLWQSMHVKGESGIHGRSISRMFTDFKGFSIDVLAWCMDWKHMVQCSIKHALGYERSVWQPSTSNLLGTVGTQPFRKLGIYWSDRVILLVAWRFQSSNTTRATSSTHLFCILLDQTQFIGYVIDHGVRHPRSCALDRKKVGSLWDHVSSPKACSV